MTDQERIPNLAAISEGEEAFRLNKPCDRTSCPYYWKSDLAHDWRTGWYDARTRKRLGHVFDRRGMTYP